MAWHIPLRSDWHNIYIHSAGRKLFPKSDTAHFIAYEKEAWNNIKNDRIDLDRFHVRRARGGAGPERGDVRWRVLVPPRGVVTPEILIVRRTPPSYAI